MKLVDIKNLHSHYKAEIYTAANDIKPRLLENLTYHELFDDSFRDPTLLEEYNKIVLPLITKYTRDIRDSCDEYLLNFINDMAVILPHTGYLNSTGEECGELRLIPTDYIPSVEIEPVWDGIQELKVRARCSPFWMKDNYTLFGNNESVVMSRYDYMPDVIKYIDGNRAKFNRSFGETNLQKMERAIKIRNEKFDYPIYVPSLTQWQDGQITGIIEEAVRRQLILKEVMENPEIIENSKVLKSKVSIDGNVILG